MAPLKVFALLVAALMALVSPATAQPQRAAVATAPRVQVQQAKSSFDKCVSPQSPGPLCVWSKCRQPPALRPRQLLRAYSSTSPTALSRPQHQLGANTLGRALYCRR
jgi:hypothetical protein